MTVILAPYDSNWPLFFNREAIVIKQALGNNCLDLFHVGSTAIPFMPAKPIIDIIAVVVHIEPTVLSLRTSGYDYKGELNIPFRAYFSKKGGDCKSHLAVYPEGHPEIDLNIKFRDYLCTHMWAHTEYEALKKHLIAQSSSHEKNSSGFTGYTLGKDAFIQKILKESGFNALCMRFCTHVREWEAARHFRQHYFFDTVPIQDPYTWTFNHQDHIHFVLYRGTEIIGYAHIQLWSELRAALRIIVILENYRGHKIGQHFLKHCEQWLGQHGYHILHVESSTQSKVFYENNGYRPMAFNDPEGHATDPRDHPLGKTLSSST